MSFASYNLPTTVVLIVTTWFIGFLFIPSGIYFLKTGRFISASAGQKYPLKQLRAFPRRLKKTDFQVTREEGKSVRKRGLWVLSVGLIALVIFVFSFVSFWRTSIDPATRIFVVGCLIIELPLIWYLVTPADTSRDA